MHTVIRTYAGPGARDLAGLLERNRDEIVQLLLGVPDMVSYTLAHTAEGCISVTVCQSPAGCEESVRLARDWVARNGSRTGTAAPMVAEGEVILQLP